MPHVATPEPFAVGTVRMLLTGGSRAMVVLDDGRTVTVCQEQVTPLVPLDRVLAVGMRVHGQVDASGKELLLALEVPSAALLDVLFPGGVVTPALVTRVGELGGELALHPNVRIAISRSDVSSNAKDRVDGLLEVGETVAARVFRHADGTIRLRTIDVDDDEPIQAALALLADGPEWIEFPPEPEVVEEVVAEAVAAMQAVAEQVQQLVEPAPVRGALRSVQLALDAERAESARLRRELDAAKATTPEEMRAVRADLGVALHEVADLGAQLKSARADVAKLRKANRDATKAAAATARDRRARFLDAESWLRFELHLTWIDRVEPQEREQYALPVDYVFGAEFASSLEMLDDDRLEKALRACVDVLTGRAATMPARAVHALRTSESGGAPDVVRADGARCMRCAIENDTASARRLHFWKRRDGVVELSRVVVHDDMTP
ncbi:hypothetical protein [uncultured Amnibacterium sp.]|uniref:hypothetical protein n=1 Tax=uncultured Amnibacterium sp. TaxID=1631851 RepID=UPI0035CA10B8